MAYTLAHNELAVGGYCHSSDQFDDEYSPVPAEFRQNNYTCSPPSSQQSGSPPDSLTSSRSSPPTSNSSGSEPGPPAIQLPINGGFSPSGMTWFLENPRIFYPFTLHLQRPPTPQALTTYNHITQLTNTVFSIPEESSARPYIDYQTIVVSCIAIQNATLGIYFGPESKHNFSLDVRDVPPHNNSHLAAEIFAAHKALKISRNIANVFGPERTAVMRVIVVTSCSLVFKTLTQWIEELNERDWEGAGERFKDVVENRAAFERADRFIGEMVDEDGLEVAFWLVGAEGVVEAERLARAKLTEAE